MSITFPKDKLVRILRYVPLAVLLVALSPLIVSLSLLAGIVIRVRRCPSPGVPEDAEGASRAGGKTMSEAMELLERLPFGRPWSRPLSAFAGWTIDLVPELLDTSKLTSGFMYPYPRPFEPVMVESEDGTPVCGLLAMQSGAAPALIVTHDLLESKNSHGPRSIAMRAYYRWGFHVLALDLRGAGDSGRFAPSPPSLGFRESEDIIAAATFMDTMERVSTVAVCGTGSGGTAALIAASSSRVEGPLAGGAVSINCYSDAKREARRLSAGGQAPITARLRTRLLLLLKTSLNGPRRLSDLVDFIRQVSSQYYEAAEETIYDGASAGAGMCEIEIPCLVLHSLDDRIVPVGEAYDLVAQALGNPMVGSVLVPGGGHALYRLTNRRWLYSTLETFFAYWGEFFSEELEADDISIFENPDN